MRDSRICETDLVSEAAKKGIAVCDPDLLPALPPAFTFVLPIWLVTHADL